MHKIGIISDTHNLLRTSVVTILRTCEVILHGGDIHSKKILDQLQDIAPAEPWQLRPQTFFASCYHGIAYGTRKRCVSD